MAWEVGERGGALILVVLWGGRLGREEVFTAVLVIVFSELLFVSFPSPEVSSPAELSPCHVMTCSTWVPKEYQNLASPISLYQLQHQPSLTFPRE